MLRLHTCKPLWRNAVVLCVRCRLHCEIISENYVRASFFFVSRLRTFAGLHLLDFVSIREKLHFTTTKCFILQIYLSYALHKIHLKFLYVINFVYARFIILVTYHFAGKELS